MIKVHFYKKTNASLIDKAIFIWQKMLWFKYPKYTHVEIEIDGMFCTSSFRDKGVRCKELKYIPTHWDVLKIETTEEENELIKDFFKSNLDKQYDLTNILFNKVLGLRVDDKDSYICSEICSEAVRLIGLDIPRNSEAIYPAGFYRYLIEYNKGRINEN